MISAPSIMISHSYFSTLPPPTSFISLSFFTDPQPLCWSQVWVQRCVCRSYRRSVCQCGRCVSGCGPSGWRGTQTLWQQLDTPASTASWPSHTSKCTFMWKWTLAFTRHISAAQTESHFTQRSCLSQNKRQKFFHVSQSEWEAPAAQTYLFAHIKE